MITSDSQVESTKSMIQTTVLGPITYHFRLSEHYNQHCHPGINSGASEIYFIASPTVLISSASLSGISMLNSSSMAITTSTVSKLSSPKSFEKCDCAEIYISHVTLKGYLSRVSDFIESF